MPAYQGLDQNFKFCVLEVTRQIEDTQEVLANPEEGRIQKIIDRDDYIDNLKSLIENKCFTRLVSYPDINKQTINQIRAIQIITSNLEKIADYCQSIVKQTTYLKQPQMLLEFDYKSFFTTIQKGLRLIVDALFSSNSQMALSICRTEFKIDRLHEKAMQEIMRRLTKGGEATGDLVTSLFIFGYLERVGDALLNIGEAIIFSIIGEKLKVHQFQAIEDGLGAVHLDMPVEAMAIESYWETRSGCRIGRIHNKDLKDNSRWVIFKEGQLKKIREEKENLERWAELKEGLAPRVFDYTENKSHAFLLVEYLDGKTFQEIVLSPDEEYYHESFQILSHTISGIWDKTIKRQPAKSKFLSQLKSRLPDVYRVHPTFNSAAQTIGGVATSSFQELLAEAEKIEEKIAAPFTVFIHGDFNTDNVIVSQDEGKIHYIDVHRSQDADYVQDISVFLISNFRIPIFAPELREKLNRSSLDFLNFCREFARQHDDETFEIRVALGLVRSLITSTRFELNEEFSKTMYLRAVYLLERIIAQPETHWSQFQLPDDILVYP